MSPTFSFLMWNISPDWTKVSSKSHSSFSLKWLSLLFRRIYSSYDKTYANLEYWTCHIILFTYMCNSAGPTAAIAFEFGLFWIQNSVDFGNTLVVFCPFNVLLFGLHWDADFNDLFASFCFNQLGGFDGWMGNFYVLLGLFFCLCFRVAHFTYNEFKI